MAQEVAQGYVTLLPSARGFGKATEQAIGGPLEGASKKGSSALGGMFKKAVGFASAAAVAMGGYFSAKKIFGGGLDRLMNIEDAQAKLKGLGHDADSVAQIMTDALGAVRGTAYGLDSAATTAASAVAAGIKPGQELEKYLKLTADAATIAGTSMDEMGSIINKVTTSGFAMTDNLNQLADRGIPIFQWLQDEYGVTADELRKMVSQGEVDAETFRRVIEENIGGAALASGDTTRGAIANLGASLSRIGANALAGVFPLFREAIVGLTGALEPVEDAAKRVGEAFGSWATGTAVPAVRGLVDLFRGDFTPALREAFGWEEDAPFVAGVLGALDEIRGGWEAMKAAFADGGTDVTSSGLAGLMESLGLAASNFVGPLMGAFQGLWEAIGPIVPQIAQAVTAFNPLGLIFKALLPILPQLGALLGDLAATVVGALGPVLAALVPVLTEVAGILVGALGEAFSALLPVITGLLPVITSLVGIVGDVLLTVITALAPLLTLVADVFAQLLPVVMSLITPLLGIVQALLPIVNIVGQLIASLLPPLVDVFMALLEPILALIAPLVEALAPVLALIGDVIGAILVPVVEILAAVLGALMPVLLPIIEVLSVLLVGALQMVVAAVDWLVRAVVGAVDKILEPFRAIVRGIKSIFGIASPSRVLMSVGSDIVSGLVNGLSNLVSSVREKFNAAKDAVLGVFKNAGTWLLGAGRKIISGLVDGITGAFDNVRNTLSDLTDRLPDWKGPARRDRRLLFDAGQLIMGGLVEGLESRYGSVERLLSGLTADIGAMSFGVDAAGVGVLPGGRTVQQTNNIYGLTAGEVERLSGAKLELAMVGG